MQMHRRRLRWVQTQSRWPSLELERGAVESLNELAVRLKARHEAADQEDDECVLTNTFKNAKLTNASQPELARDGGHSPTLRAKPITAHRCVYMCMCVLARMFTLPRRDQSHCAGECARARERE